MKSIALRDGMRIACQEWGRTASDKKVLALHGWLDNSNSFIRLGPHLASIGYHCVAVDHIGHGKSSHLSADANYHTLKSVAYVNEIVESLGWEKPSILGHSMGAGIALIFAGCFPDKVDKLLLIEGLGPVTALEQSAAKNFRRAVESEKVMALKNTDPKIYLTFAEAVSARIKSVAGYPGKQTLSVEAAQALVGRGSYLVSDDSNTTGKLNTTTVHDIDDEQKDIDENTVGAVRFRHDQRLVLPTYLYHSNSQVISYVNGVTSKTLLITATNGWPMQDSHFAMNERKKVLDDKGLLTQVHLEGSHHLHLDPESAPQVADAVTTFLQQQ